MFLFRRRTLSTDADGEVTMNVAREIATPAAGTRHRLSAPALVLHRRHSVVTSITQATHKCRCLCR